MYHCITIKYFDVSIVNFIFTRKIKKRMQSFLNLKSEDKLSISFVLLCQVGLHLLMGNLGAAKCKSTANNVANVH